MKGWHGELPSKEKRFSRDTHSWEKENTLDDKLKSSVGTGLIAAPVPRLHSATEEVPVLTNSDEDEIWDWRDTETNSKEVIE